MQAAIPENSPTLRTFVDVAPDSPFPIQNLPYGVFKRPGEAPRVGVAIGAQVLDLAALADAGLLGGVAGVFSQASLNAFVGEGRKFWRGAREQISKLLRHDNPTLRDNTALRQKTLIETRDVEMLLPLDIRGYTDFYSSIEHATNVGAMFRGIENALMPNWKHIPIGYDGRASTIVVSGTDFHRPVGQTRPVETDPPLFGPSKSVDFELELAFVVGPGNQHGRPIPVGEADQHIFGALLLNDWSARDIQKWEYQPLGPFLAKNFCTSVSPWIVTLDALEPFRTAARQQDPEPFPYLRSARSVFDLNLEVTLTGADQSEELTITRTNYRGIYWDYAQQLAHHSSNGCRMQPGDIFASGTISGEKPDSFGSLLEITWGGKNPVKLPNGEERKFLKDGDRITMRGWCEGAGYRVGFGEVTGRVLPAVVG
jgi:fumarylacetoacetase